MFCDVQHILKSNKGIQILECVFIEQVLKESFKLYRAINDGIINLVDKVGLVSILLLNSTHFCSYGKIVVAYILSTHLNLEWYLSPLSFYY